MTDELITEKFDNLKTALNDVRETIEEYIKGDRKDTDGFIKEHSEEHKKVWVEISVLKVKAGVWGAIGGAIPVAVGILVWLLTNHK